MTSRRLLQEDDPSRDRLFVTEEQESNNGGMPWYLIVLTVVLVVIAIISLATIYRWCLSHGAQGEDPIPRWKNVASRAFSKMPSMPRGIGPKGMRSLRSSKPTPAVAPKQAADPTIGQVAVGRPEDDINALAKADTVPEKQPPSPPKAPKPYPHVNPLYFNESQVGNPLFDNLDDSAQ